MATFKQKQRKPSKKNISGQSMPAFGENDMQETETLRGTDLMDREMGKSQKKRCNSKQLAPRKQASGRACRVCGKDPYPNYFYCRECHGRIDS